MPAVVDGPSSSLFDPIPLKTGVPASKLKCPPVSRAMAAAAARHAPSGACVGWGIPFVVKRLVLIDKTPVAVPVRPFKAPWIVFMHTSDAQDPPLPKDANGEWRGRGRMGDHAADYVVRYDDGAEVRLPVRRRFEVGAFQRPWGDTCMEAVGCIKPRPIRASHEQTNPGWGWSQTRATFPDMGAWMTWLWALRNPHPEKRVVGFRFEPVKGPLVLCAVTAGYTAEPPLRWRVRRKAILRLPRGTEFDPKVDEQGRLAQIRLDLGQVISAYPRPKYPDKDWARTYNNRLPEMSKTEILVEYTSHPEARFHLANGKAVPVVALEKKGKVGPMEAVKPSHQMVAIRVVQKGSRKPVAVKLHLHGAGGEYLAPVDRHRIPNAAWFEDYSVDFSHGGIHYCSYIDGETRALLPQGRVFVEVSKGFEIRPIRQVVQVTRATKEIVVEVEKVLPWREKGWVTADTHVHFLSPPSAVLEGAGEGVNVVNLLASQWGELMTNVGDFDGKTTFGSREAGGDGEYLVRVGTENRQHVMGHISLLGYNGRIIAPMTTGGPDESALGDPVANLLTEWAIRCRKQGGVVVIPHFPNPRAEHAATIVTGNADGVEMTAWGNLYGGIDPYSLLDWYRFLNCGYKVAAVGGTDKMSANTAVGTVRTYARVRAGHEFTYAEWMDAVRRAETFVTYGPLLDFRVDGHPCGARIPMTGTAGTVDVEWKVASVTVPMTKVELIVNGEVRESKAVSREKAEGRWTVRLNRSSWLALLVRGHYADKPEIITAHSSPVMVDVRGSRFHSAADALTILEQIEGSLAYLDSLGTRAETESYRRMRLILTSAGRELHNKMHAQGHFHKHVRKPDHAGHDG